MIKYFFIINVSFVVLFEYVDKIVILLNFVYLLGNSNNENL